MKSVNPATGNLIQEYKTHSDKEAAHIVDLSHQSFLGWCREPLAHRAALLRKAADILRQNREAYARLMTQEMGKVFRESLAEVDKCAWVCEYYADEGAAHLADEPVSTDASDSFVAYRPLGVVLAVMPWNFPFWQVFRFAAPALMAGNTGLLKHASNVPGAALAIESVFREAGFPENCFRTLMIGSRQVARVIENPLVMAVTLTGSTQAGKAVASKAGECLKKSVLELGGSDPYLVLEDADLDLAANACATSRLINAGQSCIAAKRFIVVESVYEEFIDKFVTQMGNRKMGDPMQEETGIGPQASETLRDELHQQVRRSIDMGAECILGGEIPDVKGSYYPPTVLSHVEKGMPAWDEELFGPVAAVIRVKDEHDAIVVANDSVFGLGSAVFTRDEDKGRRIARDELFAGCCFVNDFVKSDPRLPFGGVKESGYGRELARFGIREFLNIKTVYVS